MKPLDHPELTFVNPQSLRPNPNNARKHSAHQIDLICSSITRYGFIIPIIIDGEDVVAGHGRREAALKLKLQSVPAIDMRFVSEADRRAFAILENRSHELSSWDDGILQSELEWLFEADYDLDATGFGLEDLDLGVEIASEADDDLPQDVAATDATVSRSGDLWIAKDLRLFCGSSRDRGSFERVLGGEVAAMAFSDPPYNVPINGNVSRTGRFEEFAEASGEMSMAEFTAFLREVFRHCVAFSRDGSIHFHCMDWRHNREIQDAGDGVYTELKQLIAFVKSHGGMGGFYRSQHELIFAFKSGRGKHINTFRLGEKGRTRTNVWTFNGQNSFHKGRNDDLNSHPTVKPIALVADAILDCSHRGDLILDPFCGSGTTLLAAHRTKRRGAAIEIDPRYVDVALKRLMAAGLEVTHEDGRAFEDVRASRQCRAGEAL